MEGDAKLGVIIGCSLGGAALVVALILILVCCCTRKKRAEQKPAAKPDPVVDSGYNKYSLSKAGGLTGFQPQFVGSGTQQWRSNYSMTVAAPGVSSAEAQVRRVPSNASAVRELQGGPRGRADNAPAQQRGPWYQKSLGRARQAKRESCEILVAANLPSAHLQAAPNSAYVLNRHLEGPGAHRQSGLNYNATKEANLARDARSANVHTAAKDTRVSNVSDESRTYGSQTTLIANDYNAAASSTLDSNPALYSAFIASRGALNHGYAVPVQSPRPHPTHQEIYARSHNNSAAAMTDRNQQILLPRTHLTHEISRQRLSSVMPPVARGGAPVSRSDSQTTQAGRQPQQSQHANVPHVRPDTPAVGVHAARYAGDAKRMKVQAVIEAAPRSEQNGASQSEEKNMIGEAFKFLDDLE